MAAATAGKVVPRATNTTDQSQHTTRKRQRLRRESTRTSNAATGVVSMPAVPNSIAMASAEIAIARAVAFAGEAIAPLI
jgi:hypothetical protein